MNGKDQVLIRAYESRLRAIFVHHPDGERLVGDILTNRLTVDEIEQAFGQAEAYAWAWLAERVGR